MRMEDPGRRPAGKSTAIVVTSSTSFLLRRHVPCCECQCVCHGPNRLRIIAHFSLATDARVTEMLTTSTLLCPRFQALTLTEASQGSTPVHCP